MASSLEKQFDDFRVQFEESGTLRERIRSVVSEIESSTRLIYVTLLLVHQSRPTPGTTNHTVYHGDWKSETQPVVSMLTFMHWLETGSLLEHKEAEEKLGCMKYDLRKLEEVYYDVKIRGLTPNGESVGNLKTMDLESKDNLKLKL
ncbi:hypothetical protein JHK85_008072 [Glycine max]|nr:hypothetical protein JHK85_008072 [Glycine max]